ncbi:VRR-NUC domain-containing protein [Metapseudomonas furukawaii]|uniref:VRR-NUC domain-containing protein n=1 Tax=Metapseudomonas furukawaii TaxID=1149133 RepID=UPI00227CBC40|nr:VRR-NUC domain-containing protein [Pseudomonas furukawaii]WAG77279.1 VRR-NUC domain-containing protein [Pseudomonas furukawaii]
MPAALEDPFYYLNNFHTVLDWISDRYSDLLNADESTFIACFRALPRSSQALLVRMVMRKGELFRASKLNYVEIGETRQAAAPLVELGWIDAEPVLELTQLFDLLTLGEIDACFGKVPGRKAERLEALLQQQHPARRFADWYPAGTDCVYALKLMDTCDRLRLMFFGNLYQDWSEFVLADLGIYQYERVEIDAAARGFRERADLEYYLRLHRWRERFEAGDSLDALLPELPLEAHPNPWLDARRRKLLFQVGQHCERCDLSEAALDLYALCNYPGARVRRIRVLEKRDDPEGAFALAQEATAAPVNEEEAQHLARILPRLRRKLGLPKAPPTPRAPVQRIDLVLPRPPEPFSVEHAVLLHFHEDAAPVHYVENTLLNSLFGLLCWDAIFAPLPGAFFHPFHNGPADLLSPDFHARRAERFEACLAQLDSGEYRTRIRSTHAAKQGLQSPFVYWGNLDETLLEQALACLPAAQLKACFQRLLADIKANRAGLPDLIQFWPDQGRYRLIEVKGPGDRLQDNQLRWLEFCAQHGIPVEVCYVQWADA